MNETVGEVTMKTRKWYTTVSYRRTTCACRPMSRAFASGSSAIWPYRPSKSLTPMGTRTSVTTTASPNRRWSPPLRSTTPSPRWTSRPAPLHRQWLPTRRRLRPPTCRPRARPRPTIPTERMDFGPNPLPSPPLLLLLHRRRIAHRRTADRRPSNPHRQSGRRVHHPFRQRSRRRDPHPSARRPHSERRRSPPATSPDPVRRSVAPPRRRPKQRRCRSNAKICCGNWTFSG